MGKYDDQVKKAMEKMQPIMSRDSCEAAIEVARGYQVICGSTLNSISRSQVLSDLYRLQENVENGAFQQVFKEIIDQYKMYHSDEAISSALKIGSIILGIAKGELGIQTTDFSFKAYSKYLVKNEYYGDVWYKRGLEGVCTDMGRKIIRIRQLPKMLADSIDDALDNLLDTYIFCAFFLVLSGE